MSHTTQARKTRKNRTAVHAMCHHVSRVVGFVFRRPVLLLGMFLIAAIMQVSLLMTVGRAPVESLAPATIAAPHGHCSMFCVDSGPAAQTPTAGTTAPADQPHAPAPAATPSASSCWMFCSTSDVHVSAAAEYSATLVPWRMPL